MEWFLEFLIFVASWVKEKKGREKRRLQRGREEDLYDCQVIVTKQNYNEDDGELEKEKC